MQVKRWWAGLLMIGFFVITGGTGLATTPLPDTTPVQLVADGSKIESVDPIFIFNNRVMISLSALPGLLDCEAYAQPGQIKIIFRDTFITMYPCRTDYLVNSEVKQSDTAPLITETGAVYIPLRLIAQEIPYDMVYDPHISTLYLQSPEYSKTHPLPSVSPVQPVPPPAEFKPAGNWGTITGNVALFPESNELIVGYYTRLINSPEGRTTNIMLSCVRINGTTLQPGEVFSFNRTVGERTSAAGYQMAAIFAGKKVINGIGGGICQTATTLYNMALEAGLNIVERHPHSMSVTYTAPGRDATVAWNAADLRFANTLDYPVKILCKIEGNYVVTALVKE